MQLATMQSSMGGQALTMRRSPAQPSRSTFHCVARKQLTPKESRIGKALIPVPQGVTVTIDGQNVAVKVCIVDDSSPPLPPRPSLEMVVVLRLSCISVLTSRCADTQFTSRFIRHLINITQIPYTEHIYRTSSIKLLNLPFIRAHTALSLSIGNSF